MKEFDMRAVMMSSAIAAMTLTAAVAQAAPATREQVKVPFAFTVNGQEMPAGTYAVRHDDDQPYALLIQGSHESVYVMTAPVSSSAAPQDISLVFAKDGDRYRLTQVWDEDGEGVSVVGSR
jgi:hypothetical protein